MVSETDELDDGPVFHEELAELERRINQQIDDTASIHVGQSNLTSAV